MTSVIPWLLQRHSSPVTLRATQVVWTQMMVTSDMWYIDEGFLVWIIPSTYQPHEFIIWAYTTSFVHTYIYRVFSVFITCLPYFVAWLCVPMLSRPFSMHVFRFWLIDIHVFTWPRIYCHFPYISCHYLYLHIWITSLDHVYVYLLCIPFGFIICTRRAASDNPEFSCPESGVWTVTALMYLIRVAQRECGLAIACPDPLSSSILDRLARFSSCYSWVLSSISYCTSCFCAS